jgi:hypothetical protein
MFTKKPACPYCGLKILKKTLNVCHFRCQFTHCPTCNKEYAIVCGDSEKTYLTVTMEDVREAQDNHRAEGKSKMTEQEVLKVLSDFSDQSEELVEELEKRISTRFNNSSDKGYDACQVLLNKAKLANAKIGASISAFRLGSEALRQIVNNIVKNI